MQFSRKRAVYYYISHEPNTPSRTRGPKNKQKGFLEERYIVLLECKYINIKNKKFEVK